MTDFDLIEHVVPKGGIYNVVGIDKGRLRPKFTDSLEEANSIAQELSAAGMDVYFALGKLKEKGNRRVENVESLGAIWLDIDCGGEKATEIESSTGLPKGYATRGEGSKALKEFCETVDLPDPIIVSSGYGLHVYWAFTEEVPTESWQPIADKLAQICKIQEFYADPNVYDAARILRVPGTYNHKQDTPRLVKVVQANTARHAPDDIRALLGVDPGATAQKKTARPVERSEWEEKLQQNKDYKFTKIVGREDPCLQLKDCLINRATLSEPRWFNALSIAKFCSDADKAVHAVSKGHPDYDPNAVERKVLGIKGPHSCEEFRKNNPDGCKGCAHRKTITRPLELGKIVKRAKNSHVDRFEGYFQGENGGVYTMVGDDAKLVYEHEFYLKKQMYDTEKFVSVFVFHSPNDGIREFSVDNDRLEKRDLIRLLAAQGVITLPINHDRLHTYVIRSIQLMQERQKSEVMRTQFGWADHDTKFVVGDREITVEGVYHTPPSKITKPFISRFQPRGSLEKWSEVFNTYNREGLEVQAFAALSGFGAPLLKFTGQKGAIINLVHRTAGTGKTTVLRAANSIAGHPEYLLGNPKDTVVGRVTYLGVLNNIVRTIDELSNVTKEDLSDFAYECSQGKGKEKGRNDISTIRDNDTTWRTITLTSSNSSFYQKLMAYKNLADGEMMRIIELNVPPASKNAIPVEEGRELFDTQLNENHGLAIEPYMQWVLANLEDVKILIKKVQRKIDKELQLTQRERNWSAVLAANIVGGMIANNIGLIDFDMPRIFNKAGEILLTLRKETTAPVDNYVSVIGDLITQNLNKVLIVNDKADKRTSLPSAPQLEPKFGEIFVRWEPDTNKIFIPVKQLRRELLKDETNYDDFIKDLKQRGIYIKSDNKRLSKGMAITAPSQRCCIFDASHPEFLQMNNLMDQSDSDADREGGVPDKLEKI